MRPQATPMTGARRLRGLAAAAAIVAAVALMTAGGCTTRSTYPPAPPPAPRPETSPPQTQPGQPRPYKALGQWYQPLPDAKGFRQQGIASWYGPDFHGKRSSSGETYDMHDMTAAHKTLPLGTKVRVTNLKSGESVDVEINDRGPHVKGRVVDLSKAAARELGMTGAGLVKVQVEVIEAANDA